MEKTYLVTGGAGFVGSHFVRVLLRRDSGARVVNLDSLSYAGSLDNLRDLPDPRRHDFVRGDIRDRGLVERLLRERAITTIVHFAAETHVDRSIRDPEAFVNTNVLGTLNLLEAARAIWLRAPDFPPSLYRFHHISTDEVYGSPGPGGAPVSENSPYDPHSPYAASKAAADHLVRAFHHTYGLPLTVTVSSNTYGPAQHLEKFAALSIYRALHGQPIPLYGDGLQIRDWLYVEDHCEAVRLALERGEPGRTYLVGGGNQTTNLELAGQICDLVDERLPDAGGPRRRLIRRIADRPGHDRRYALDDSRTRRDLGWAPAVSLADGLRRTVDWFLANAEWVEARAARPEYREWIAAQYPRTEGAP